MYHTTGHDIGTLSFAANGETRSVVLRLHLSFCGTSGYNFKIAGLRSDCMTGWGQKCAKMCFFLDLSKNLIKMHTFIKTAFY